MQKEEIQKKDDKFFLGLIAAHFAAAVSTAITGPQPWQSYLISAAILIATYLISSLILQRSSVLE